ncbi:hypothetical protein EW093_15155 [Thiospirochaeta perfilievii]|uniref:Ig-like domain-containing protein n=1 Tax=Thiospirochaeta perfilievii TaxID=252967 RepID=A0A5C1QF02_9SPIO|nr:Ig-like domain-containing protein [Thiospirochaeta perfilievii]QEN05977.1 hypothetical protein EW093_15155 [Thiospirochaeta perfilievii]
MISKIYYFIVATLIIATLVACELFTSGYGEKVDLSEPSISISDPVNVEYKGGTFTLKGVASDDTSIKEVVVEFKSPVTNDTKTRTATLSDNNWYLDIDSDDSSIFKDGEVEFTVTAIDSVDKKSSKNIIVYLDNTLPTVLVESPNSQDKDIINGILDVIGSAKDASLEKLEVYIVSSDDPTKRYLGVTEGTSSWKATFNTEKLEIGLLSSQTYYLEVIAYDVAGNQSSYFYYNDDLFSEEMTQIKSDLGINSRPIDMLADINNIDLFESIQRSDSLADRLNFNIYQDRDRPEIILSSDWDLSSPDNLKSFTNSVNLSAQVKDDDGIKTIVLSVYKKSDNSLVRQGTIKPLGSRSYNLDVILDSVNWSGFTMTPDLSSGILPEDSYYFTLTVTDIEGAFSGVADLPNPANFGIDRNNPEVKILSSLSNKYYNSNVDVIIEAKDNVGVTKVDLYINDVDDKTPLSAIKQDDGNWKYTVKTLDYITEEDLDVNLSIKVVASDASGKTDTESMSIYLDILPPVLEDSKITMPASLNQTVEIEVTPVDKNLDSVEYNLDNEEDWKPVSKVDGSTSIITLLTTDYADGNHTLNLKAIDTAGNITELSKIITIDQDSDKPVITFKTPDETNDINSFSGAVTILAELKDDDAIDEESIVLKIDDEKVIASEYIKQNVGGVVTLKYTPTFDDDGDHSVSVFVADKKDIGVVKDVTKNIDFVIDSRGPTINNIKVDSEVISSLMYKKSDFTLSGNAADLKDVSKITIKATFGDSEPVIYVIPFDAVTPNVTWIQIINVDGNVNDSEEKPLTVTIEAIDAAGNSSGIVTKNLIIDKIKPVLDSVLSSNIENLNGIETISGGASDDHLSSVKIAYIGKNDGKTSWLNIEGSPYSWKYYLDTKKIEDGNSTFYVQATDLSGNISNKEYTINIDQLSDKPQFIFDKPIISGGNETTNLFGSSASVSGSVTDDDGIDRGEINIYLYDYDNVLLYTTNFIPTPGGSDKSIPWEFDLSSLSQGIYYIQVEAKDDIDYKLNGDVVSSNISNKNIFAIDFGAPTLDISSPLNATTEITYLNSQMILAGNVKDGLGVKTLTYQLGSLDKVTIFTDKQYLDYNWSKTLTLDELKLAGTSFSINLEATDITGKVIKSTMPVFIDESGPILTVTTPLNNSINESSPISLEGTILDLGSGFSYPVDGDLSSLNYDLAYSLNSGVDVPISLTEGDTKWLKDLELTTEGTYNLKFKSKDRIGNVKNSSNITFYYDKSKPDFTEVDSTYSETEVLTNSSVNFGGHLSDSNGLLAFNVKVNTEDEINLLSSVESNGTWSYTLPKVDGIIVLHLQQQIKQIDR